MEDNNTTTNCPTCGWPRETAGNTTKYFIPPVESKPNEYSKANPNAKYQILDAIMQKHWIKRNKLDGPELLLNCNDDQMIYDCMEEYAALKLSEANSENARLQSQLAECRRNNQGMADAVYEFFKQPK